MQRQPLNSTQALTIAGLVLQHSAYDAMTSRMTKCTPPIARQTALHATLPGNGSQQSLNHEKIIQLAGFYKLWTVHRCTHDAGVRSDSLYLSSRKGCQLDRLANDRPDKKGVAEPACNLRVCLFNSFAVPPLFHQLESIPLLPEIKDQRRP